MLTEVLPLLAPEQRGRVERFLRHPLITGNATPTHAELGPDHILINEEGKVAGLIAWGDPQIGDPALDFCWLLKRAPAALRRAVELSYQPGIDDRMRDQIDHYFRLVPWHDALFWLREDNEALLSDQPYPTSSNGSYACRAGGRIISIGSCFAERVPYPGVSLYAMSKSALIGLTKGLARDLGARAITANVIHPGSTDTVMNPADGEGAEEERRFIALGHYASTEDIAATVAHLAGEGGRYITGASIAVDGGFAA